MFYISSHIFQQMLYFASIIGIDEDRLSFEAGVDLSILKRLENRIPLEEYGPVLAAAIDLSGDPDFGLHMGEHARLGDLSILGYIMANCRTLEDVLGKVAKYFGSIGSVFDARFTTEKEYSKIVFKMKRHPRCCRHCMEAAMVSIITILNHVLTTPIEFQEVSIAVDAPEDAGEYSRIFQCPVTFNQPDWALIIRPAALAVETSHPDPRLLLILEQHADSLVKKMNVKNYLSEKISALLFQNLSGGSMGIEDAARALGMSIRAMQRKLKEENVTFSRIASNVRKELARGYLAETGYSIDDITYLLGFSEPSVFRRAFKTWTGLTPGQYRSSDPTHLQTLVPPHSAPDRVRYML